MTMRRLLVPAVAALMLAAPLAAPAAAASIPVISSINPGHRTFTASPAFGSDASPEVRVTGVAAGDAIQIRNILVPASDEGPEQSELLGECTALGSPVTFNGSTTNCLVGGTFSFPTANFKYTIRALVVGSVASAPWDYTYDDIAPHTIASITATPIEGAEISLTWDRVIDNQAVPEGGDFSGVDHYVFTRNKNSGGFQLVDALKTADSSCAELTCTTVDVRSGADASEPADGSSYVYSVVPVDRAGNAAGAGPVSSEVAADGTPPAAPGDPVVLDGDPDADAGWGDNPTPLITTTLTEGGFLQLLVDGNPVGGVVEATTTGDYTWNGSGANDGGAVDLSALSGDGTYQISVSSSDVVGNTSTSGATAYVLDTVAPDAPSISSVAGFDTSPALGNSTSPAVVVSGAATGEHVILSVDENGDETLESYERTAASDVAFDGDVALSGTNREVEFTAQTRDQAGNLSIASAPFVYEWDTIAPAVPAAPTVGQVNGGGGVDVSWTAVTDAAPYADKPVTYDVYRGTATPTAPDTCPASPDTAPTRLAGPSTATSYNDSSATDGTCVYYAIVAIDRVGNSSDLGAVSAGIEADMAAPAVPTTPTVVDLTGSADAGHGNDNTPLISTTTDEAGLLRLLVDGVPFGSPIVADAATEYTWNDDESTTDPSLDLDDLLGDGTYEFTVSISDELGNKATTPATSYTLDRVAPADAAITEIDGQSSDAVTNDTTPTVVVANALAGEYALLTLDHDGDTTPTTFTKAAASAVTFNSSGGDFTLSGDDRAVALSATIRDAAGNLAATPATASLDLDRAAPAVPAAPTTRQASGGMVEVDWADVSDTAPWADRPVGYRVQKATSTPNLITSTCPGADVGSYSTISGSVPILTSKFFDTSAADGTCVHYKVIAVDQVGNESAASTGSAGRFVDDSVAPAAPVIDSSSPSEGQSGTPAIVVNATEPGGTITLLNGTTAIANKAVPQVVDPSVTFAPGDYSGEAPHGVSTLTAKHTNNSSASAESAGFDYRRAPATPVIDRVEGDTTSPASGTDPTPDVTVSGVVSGHTISLWATPSGSSTPTKVAQKVASSTSVAFATSNYPNTLLPGTYTLTAKATDPDFTDAATGTSAASAGFTYERIGVTGGYIIDGWGGIHSIGSTLRASGQPYFPGRDVVRDIALIDINDPSKGGYALDSWGGIHAFNGAPAARGGAYWPGRDVARDLVVIGPGKGYVLDMHGASHPFGGAPRLRGTPYWPTQDIARRLVLTGPSSGYVLDGFGAPHRFGGAPALRNGPYWLGWDIANDLALIDPSDPSKGGYVLDGFGGVHPIGGAPRVKVSAYQAGSPHRFHSIAVTGSGAGYTADTRGLVARFGSAPAVVRPATFSFDIGRGLAIALL